MIEHHPSHDLLTEFAAGTLDIGQAIAVSAHLHFCTQCQQIVQAMEQTGGIMLEELPARPLSDNSFDQLMQAIDQQQPCVHIQDQGSKPTSNIPHVVQSLTQSNPPKWRKITGSLQAAPLVAGQSQYEISLHKIQAGDKSPEHDHGGIEITIVLQGSFSDKYGIYHEGDFLVKQPGDIHQPAASHHEDCLCLSIQEAPLKLTSFFGRFMNPFIRLHAA